MSVKTYGNFINGEWIDSPTGRTFSVHNPAHRNELIARFQSSEPSDVRRAIDAAEAALDGWGKLPAPKRASFLKKAADILARRRDEAATLLTREEGKPITEARGEIDRGIGLLEFYAGQGFLLNGETYPSSAEGRFLYTMRAPLGVVALITPWNFPSAIPIWKAAPALLCGNTIVMKPASLAPASAALLAEVFCEAGLPAGVFNLVTGGGREVGDPLILDPRVKCISFTGSVDIGRQIMEKAGPRFIRIGLEMGGKNPFIIMDDADLDRAVADTVVGAFWSCGHKCTATSRVLVMESIYDAFVEKLVKRVAELKIGDGINPDTQICPVIDEKQLKSVLRYVDIGRNEGAKLAIGGQRLTGGIFDEGWYVSPAVFVDVTPSMRIAQEEIFGPVLSVIKVCSFDEAIAVSNNVEFGLSAGIATRSLARSMEFARRIDAGLLHVNSPTAGVELQLPFGGCKNSTSGYREMGKAAIDFYSIIKTVYVDG